MSHALPMVFHKMLKQIGFNSFGWSEHGCMHDIHKDACTLHIQASNFLEV